MADNNKTIEEQLAEIDRAKVAEAAKIKAARAKKKRAEAKADAEYKAQEETKARIAKENMQRGLTDSAGSPQKEVGKIVRAKSQADKSAKQSVATEWSQIVQTQGNLIEKYKKTGDANDRQAVINFQSKVDIAAKKYSGVVGHAPTGYTGKLDLPPAPEPVVKPASTDVSGVKTTSNAAMESRDAARSAGRNAAPAPKISSTAPRIDPNVVNTYMAANPGMTYDQAVAALYPSSTPSPETTGSPGPSGMPSRTVSVNKNVQTFTAQQLEGAATQYAQDLLGRALTSSELARITKFTNTEAMANPQISRTVTKNKTSGSTSTTTTKGGIDEGQIIKSQIEENPEYANYQKATTYFDAMTRALQGPVGGGI